MCQKGLTSQVTLILPTVSTREKLSPKGQRVPEMRSEPTLLSIRTSRVETLTGEIIVMSLVNIH